MIDWDKCIFFGDNNNFCAYFNSNLMTQTRFVIPITSKRCMLVDYGVVMVNKNNISKIISKPHYICIWNVPTEEEDILCNDHLTFTKEMKDAITRKFGSCPNITIKYFDSKGNKEKLEFIYELFCNHHQVRGLATCDEVSRVQVSPQEDGAMCRICGHWYPMAPSDGLKDGKMNCWNCTNYRQFKVAVMMRSLLA